MKHYYNKSFYFYQDERIISVKIGGEWDELMIDSGAHANTITLSHWRKICGSKDSEIFDVNLKPPNTLKGYGGNEIKSIATFTADIETTGGLRKLKREEFHVVNKTIRGLISFETAKRMNLIHIGESINVVENKKAFPKVPNLKIKLNVDKSVTPTRNCNYRIPWALQSSTQAQLDELENQNIIERARPDTDWMSKLNSVEKGTRTPEEKRKKTPERRLVVNMRAVNEAIIRENHPMPYLEHFLPKLVGAKHFTKLDLSSAFYHIELDEESRDLTAFMTARGPMRFTRLPFGINAAPEIFQRTMESILNGLEGTIIYLDDILIFASSESELKERTEETVKRLNLNNLTINKRKSEYNKTKITFLGHEISQNGVRPMTSKIEAIKNFRLPTNKGELRSFLGLVTYIGASIENLSKKTAILRAMLRKSAKFSWSKQNKDAFSDLKKHIGDQVMQRGFFQTEAETHLYTDASPTALGAVLVQLQTNLETNENEKRVITCISKSLTDTEQRYPQTHKEALAIVWAVEKLHFYLLGREFVIYTDHEPLEYVFKRKNISDKRAMTRAEGWALRLSSYHFKIRHVSSTENIADPLSRICDQKDAPYSEDYGNYGLFSIEQSFDSIDFHYDKTRICEETIVEETTKDEECRAVISAIENNAWEDWDLKKFKQIAEELSYVDGTIRRGTKIVLPRSLRKIAIEIAHQGHSGASSMKRHLRAHFWWPAIDSDVDGKRETCETCILMQKDNPPAPMKRSEMPKGAWKFIALDYYSSEGPIPLKILVLQDYFSKYVKLRFVKSTGTKEATDFLNDAFENDGIPDCLISDNGPPFQGSEFINWCKARNIKVKKSTPALPRANGMVERFMQTLSRTLTALKLEGTLTAQSAISTVKNTVFTYNRRPHKVTERTPFSLMRGREPTDLFPSVSDNQTIEFEALKEQVEGNQEKGKLYSDRYYNAKSLHVNLGDEVAIRNFNKKKLDSNYNPNWFKVVGINGTELTLERDGKTIRRNVNHVIRRPDQASQNQTFSHTQDTSLPLSAKGTEVETSSPPPSSSEVTPAAQTEDEPPAEPRPKRLRKPNPKYIDGIIVMAGND